MDVRTRILTATAELLASSADGDVATRAVCDAAGVAPTALYRQFGDKAGLLAAVVDYGYEQYLATKRALATTDDPVADLRTGWDNHTSFALDNPTLYRLMWVPGMIQPPGAAGEAHQLLRDVLDRCAVAGRLMISPQSAVQMIMSANVGVCLSLVARPELYPEPGFGTRVRDAVFAAVVTPDPPPGGRRRTATVRRGADAPTADAARGAAAALGAQLRTCPSPALSGTENALLDEWLTRVADGTNPQE